MEITTRRAGDVLEMSVAGRLDAYWADHLARALEEAIRDGSDRIRLDLGGVTFISSVGLRVLLRFHRQHRQIGGAFVVSNPSEAVKRVLALAGLEALLVPPDTASAAEPHAPTRALERGGMRVDVFELARGASLRCQVVGLPDRVEGCRFTAEHCRTMGFPASTLGVGLGAFGDDFVDCQARFGEFLAAAGTAAYLPTDGTNVPDYVISAGALVPELKILYALACDGHLAKFARFETRAGDSAVGLTALVDVGLEIAGRDAVGMVMVAESAGLVGAALRRSPAYAPAASAPFAYPEIRNWLSFTPERAHPRSLALVVGVAIRGTHPALEPLVRPLGAAGSPAGHFHAAAFSYRPLARGTIDLVPTVSTLFQAETLQGILHLLPDDRAVVGAGESEFVRGACWLGPITEIVAEGAAA
jgi:anti-anti-sigma factor